MAGLPFSPSGEALTKAVAEKPGLTSLLVAAGLVLALRPLGGGGSGVRFAQGALVTPSTMPTGGFDGRAPAQGAAVPGPASGNPEADPAAHGAAVGALLLGLALKG